MQLGLVGLGKMGFNMRERIRSAGHEVVGYDRNPDISDVGSLPALVKALDAPRVVWVMVPHGGPTRDVVQELSELLDKGDLVIDGGNSRFTDDFEHDQLLKAKGIGYLDCGVSGGIWGLDNGYGLMVGGTKANVKKAMPIFDALRPEGPRDEGFVHAGEVGAGHYVKMVHNGIEYGLMHAYAEGYELLEKKDIVKDVPGSFKAWSRGTVVRSWLLDLLVKALEENPTMEDVSDYTSDSGEGRWTVEEAIELGVPMPVISASLFARFASRQKHSPAMQAVAALRGQFGGHHVMTHDEGEALRNEYAHGPRTLGKTTAASARKEQKAAAAKQATKKSTAAKAKKAAVKGSEAASAGPSSGSGSTNEAGSSKDTSAATASKKTAAKNSGAKKSTAKKSTAKKATTAGPTSGTGSTKS